MRADAQPLAFSESLSDVDEDAQLNQYRDAHLSLTRLRWSSDWVALLHEVVLLKSAAEELLIWLEKEDPDAASVLRRLLQNGLQTATGQTKQSAINFADGSLRKFMILRASSSLIKSMVQVPQVLDARTDLLWSAYALPLDCAGWLHAFVIAADQHPYSIVVSDMSLPGAPMIFVNRSFCQMTEFSANEIMGKSCRVLQGRRTEVCAVRTIQRSLRCGKNCDVQISNYRKSGECFQNLLSLRPVHDTNHVYRFCIGVQCEVSVKLQKNESERQAHVSRLKEVLAHLPTTIEVSSPPVGAEHHLDVLEQAADDVCKADAKAASENSDSLTESFFGADRQQLLSDLALKRFGSHFFWYDPLLSATIDDSVAVAVSDAQLPGFPLVMVNRVFETLTGFTAGEVLGRNCSFLQCQETERHVIRDMSAALRSQTPCEVRVTNRRKNGSIFINILTLTPVLDYVTGCTRLVIATQREETKALLVGTKAHNEAASLVAAIPHQMRFSVPTLQVSLEASGNHASFPFP